MSTREDSSRDASRAAGEQPDATPLGAAKRYTSGMRCLAAVLALCTACAGGTLEGRRPRPAVPVVGGVQHEESAFEGYARVRIFEQWWKPAPGSVRATVVIVHGLKDHSTRYAELADRLAQHGYAVYALDLRGHGSSGGRRAYVESFEEYVDDLGTFVDEVQKREQGKPLFLLGHSMGGTIALDYLLEKKPQVAGVVLSGAALKVGLSGFKRTLTKAAGTVLPLLAILSVDVERLSRDPAVVRACKDDPLIEHGNGPARTARELLDAMDAVSQREKEVRVPLLILHGGDDAITEPEGSRELYERAGSQDKSLHVYDGMYHDIWREPARERVMDDLANWLDAHAQPYG
jgi:alpha-beta hydrolase superfamily lysophospholipase